MKPDFKNMNIIADAFGASAAAPKAATSLKDVKLFYVAAIIDYLRLGDL